MISDEGVKFIQQWEGLITRAYPDSGGVWTIGYGFTMMDPTFAAYWRGKGHSKIERGQTISASECEGLLRTIINRDYAVAVDREFYGIKLSGHQYDACCSVAYNAGPGALKDQWAKALKRGDVAGAAALLRKDRVTAGGRFVQGLANRRKAEAALLLKPDYVAKQVTPGDVVAVQTKLEKVGAYNGPKDGVLTPETTEAIEKVQELHPDLKVDGVAGQATETQLNRMIASKKAPPAVAAATVGVAAVGAAGGAWFNANWIELAIGLGGLGLVAVGGYFVYKYATEFAVLHQLKKES